MKKKIEVNLSIERSQGAENLAVIINKLDKVLKDRFPDAEVIVRKGYFQTIDGIFSNDVTLEPIVRTLLAEVREEVLS